MRHSDTTCSIQTLPSHLFFGFTFPHAACVPRADEAVLPRKGAWEDHPLFCEFPQTAGPFASHAHLWRSHRLSVARRRDAVKGLMDPTEHGAEKKGMRQF